MKIGIIGFGALGQQMYHFLKNDIKYKDSDYYIFDDIYKSEVLECHQFHDFRNNVLVSLHFFIGLGYKNLTIKNDIISWLKENDRILETYLHATTIKHPETKIEAGVFIYPGCILDQRVQVGAGSVLNNGVIISHDTIIGQACFLSPGVIVCGFNSIGDMTFIGAGSILANNISIGTNATIGIGSNVTSDVGDNTSAIGNPLRIISKLKIR